MAIRNYHMFLKLTFNTRPFKGRHYLLLSALFIKYLSLQISFTATNSNGCMVSCRKPMMFYLDSYKGFILT